MADAVKDELTKRLNGALRLGADGKFAPLTKPDELNNFYDMTKNPFAATLRKSRDASIQAALTNIPIDKVNDVAYRQLKTEEAAKKYDAEQLPLDAVALRDKALKAYDEKDVWKPDFSGINDVFKNGFSNMMNGGGIGGLIGGIIDGVKNLIVSSIMTIPKVGEFLGTASEFGGRKISNMFAGMFGGTKQPDENWSEAGEKVRRDRVTGLLSGALGADVDATKLSAMVDDATKAAKGTSTPTPAPAPPSPSPAPAPVPPADLDAATKALNAKIAKTLEPYKAAILKNQESNKANTLMNESKILSTGLRDKAGVTQDLKDNAPLPVDLFGSGMSLPAKDPGQLATSALLKAEAEKLPGDKKYMLVELKDGSQAIVSGSEKDGKLIPEKMIRVENGNIVAIDLPKGQNPVDVKKDATVVESRDKPVNPLPNPGLSADTASKVAATGQALFMATSLISNPLGMISLVSQIVVPPPAEGQPKPDGQATGRGGSKS